MIETEQHGSPLTPFQLNDLGFKIFMDRYAWKDYNKELKIGDIVVADIGNDIKWKKKEPSRITAIGSDNVDTKDDMLEITLEVMSTGETITKKRYELDICKEQDIADARARMAHAMATHELGYSTETDWYAEFMWLLDDARYVPAGRVWTTLGTDQLLTMYNCYVINSPEDSMQGIRKTLEEKQEIMRRGGGVGINLSSLRPRNAYARGVNGRSSGSVSWGSFYSFSTGLIEQGGSRRGALMLILNDWHPDIVEFICSKNKKEAVEKFQLKYGDKFPGATFHAHGIDNANISVGVSDAFMDAVKSDADWDLVFPDYEAVDAETYHKEWNGVLSRWIEKGYPVKKYATVRARDLWELIIESAWSSAEPGVVFLERYNKMGNQWYYEDIIATNPCGRLGLLSA